MRSRVMALVLACSSAGPDQEAPDGGTTRPGAPDGGQPTTGDEEEPGCPIAGGPAEEAVFTAGGADADLAIEDRLVAFIEAARSGTTVRAAFAYLDQPRVADALIAAHERKVDVRLVLDERNQQLIDGTWQWNSAVASLRSALGDDHVLVCGGAETPPDGGGCIARDKQHNAFVLVSETCDGSHAIVLQTSAYPTKSQLFRRDDLVVVRDDDALFAAYAEYWNDLARQRRNNDYYRTADGASTRLFLYPRAATGQVTRDPATDTVYRLLHDNVECAGGTRVRLAMSFWTTGRDYLVDELRRLATAGCDVGIVANPDTTDGAVASALRAGFDADHLGFLPGVHHKYLVVDGAYAGDPDAHLVWTGSQDFTSAALRDNDELLLRLDSAAFRDRFMADWSAMFAAAPR